MVANDAMQIPEMPKVHGSTKRNTPVIYYGTDLPLQIQSQQLRDAIVVLQPYHPLCQSGEFANYFPDARRFVYFNPTAVHERLLTDPEVQTAILSHDPAWDLYRLDLRRVAARRFVIKQGLIAMQVAGVHGLFVDDLDKWDYPSGRRYARTVLMDIVRGHDRQIEWFVNRGFGFWNHLPSISAVLLEELSPYQLDRMDPLQLSWVRTVVLRALNLARSRGAAMYSLTYDMAAIGWQPRGSAASKVAALTGEPLFAQRHLDRWPDALNGGRH